MHNEPADTAFDETLGHALRALPPVRAPRALVARVLALTVDAAPRPWYARTWFAWPREWQAASVVALGGLVAAFIVLAPSADPAIAGAASAAGAAADRAGSLLHGASVIAAFVRVLCRSILLPAACIGFAAAVGVALAGSACWTTFNRLAFDDTEGAAR